MAPRTPYRIYLVLDPFHEVLPKIPKVLQHLAEIDPYLPGADGFYYAKTDAALIGLQFQRRAVENIGQSYLIELVAECGLPVIAPEELPEEEYWSFFGQHLPAYPVQINHKAGKTRGKPLIQFMVECLKEAADKERKKVAARPAQPPVQSPILSAVPSASQLSGQTPMQPNGRPPAADITFAKGTGTNYDNIEVEEDFIEIELSASGPAPRNERASSRWELVLEDEEDDSSDGRPASEWDLVL